MLERIILLFYYCLNMTGGITNILTLCGGIMDFPVNMEDTEKG